MLFEYAVEPQAIGSSWQTFRYVIEKFGFDKGRLIVEYPKHWFREVHDATAGLRPVEKLRVVEALNQARRSKVVRSRRPYDRDLGDWLANALTEHRRLPFRAIIAAEHRDGIEEILCPDEFDELHPLMAIPHDSAVARDAASIAAAVKELLRFSTQILFVDPFFDPYSARYKSTLRECLRIVKDWNPSTVCEIHYRFHPDKPAQAELAIEAPNLFRGVLPDGIKVRIFCWRERNGGADFHARYLLTERGGIAVDAGFSAEGSQQTTDMHLMSYELSQSRLQAFAHDAQEYELQAPILEVSADGAVRHL